MTNPKKVKPAQNEKKIIFSRFKMIEKKYLHFQLKSFIDSF